MSGSSERVRVARCPRCDLPFAIPADRAHKGGCMCESCVFLCWSSPCHRDPVDWRARALAAEAVLRLIGALPARAAGGGTVPARAVLDADGRPVGDLRLHPGDRLAIFDLHPRANWAHPCVYVVVAPDGQVRTAVHDWPPSEDTPHTFVSLPEVPRA